MRLVHVCAAPKCLPCRKALIAKAKLDCALRLSSEKFKNKSFANTLSGFTDLKAWLIQHGAAQAHICMEATGTYWEAVAECLVDADHTVSVVNPFL